MHDPSIQSYSRPIYDEEDSFYGDLDLKDHFFNYGIYLEIRGEPVSLPEKIGRFYTYRRIQTEGEGFARFKDILAGPVVPCSQVFTELSQSLNGKREKAYHNGVCADP